MGSHQQLQYYHIDLDFSQHFNKCWMLEKGDFNLTTVDLSYVYTDFEATVLGLIVASISITGTILNAVVICALLRNPEIRKEYLTPSIISIAVTDLIFCVLCLPVHSLHFFTQDMPLPSCQLFAIIGFGTWICSEWNLLGVAVLRLSVINSVNNSGVRGVFPRARKFIPISTWIVTYLLIMPTLLNKYGRFGLECRSMTCKMISLNVNDEKIKFGPERFFGGISVIIGIILLFLNIALYRQVRKKVAMFVNDFEDSTNENARKWLEKEKKVGKMMGTVTVLYFLVYCLVVAVRVVIGPNSAIDHPWLTAGHYLIAWSIGVIDPMVYIFWRKKYRDEVKSLLNIDIKNCTHL